MPPNDLSAMPAHVLPTVLRPKTSGHKKSWTHLLPQYPVACRILGGTAQKEIDPEETAKKQPKNITTSIFA